MLLHLEAHGRSQMGEVAASIGVGRPAVSKLVGQLERRGHVTRTIDEHDRRTVHVQLTERCRRELATCVAPLVTGLQALVAELDAQEQRTVASFLDRVVAGMRRL